MWRTLFVQLFVICFVFFFSLSVTFEIPFRFHIFTLRTMRNVAGSGRELLVRAGKLGGSKAKEFRLRRNF